MTRSRAVLSAAVTVVAFTVAPTSLAAAAPTCQLQTATITSSGGTVTGTEGPDVIVATGTTDIHALGGDDTICMQHGTVDAGAGDDAVYDADLPGTNTDSFDLGPGYDYLDAPMPPGSHVTADGGNGQDHAGRGPADDDYVLISGLNDSEDWVVDLAGSVTRGGVEIAALSGFGTFHIDFASNTKVSVIGTDAPEYLLVAGGDLAVDMAGGRDQVSAGTGIETIGQVAGGAGKDELTLNTYGAIDANLATGDLGKGLMGAGFEQYYFQARHIRVLGSAADEQMAFYAYHCDARIKGGGGDDRIRNDQSVEKCRGRTVLTGGAGADVLKGNGRPESLLGGRGDDTLVGGGSDDVLVGGPGKDTANGGPGSDDVCRAEVERGCER